MLKSSDRKIHEKVLVESACEPSLRAGRIGIAVEEGVVTLFGTVETFAEKWAAEDAVKRVVGVRGLAADLKVELPGFERRNDLQIAETTVRALEALDVPSGAIRVEVEDGCVTLTGVLDRPYDRDVAIEADIAVGEEIRC